MTHGTKFVPIVICVNNVELEKTQKGNTSIISFENPSIGNAKLDFIVPDPSIQVKGYLVQRDLTKIDVRWSGFEDKSGIMSFECKLQKGGDMIMNWVAVGRKDYASFNNLSLRSQEVYTVFVRAVNIGNKTSSPINASIYTTSKRPGLTGNDAILMFLDRIFCCLKKHFHDEAITEPSDNIRILFGTMVFMHLIG